MVPGLILIVLLLIFGLIHSHMRIGADMVLHKPRDDLYLISIAKYEKYVAAIRIILPVAVVAMGLRGLMFDLSDAHGMTVAKSIA